METRVFRLTVRFLPSTTPAPCDVQKPNRFLSSKTLPPLSPFYSGCVMCNGVGCGCSSSACPPPLQGRSIMNLLTAWERTLPCRPGEHLPEVVNNVHLSSAPWRLFTDLRIPDREKSKPRSANPVSLAQGCEPPCPLIHGNPVWWEKSISSQHWLCCIMKISYAAGNSLLPKSLQNGSRN